MKGRVVSAFWVTVASHGVFSAEQLYPSFRHKEPPKIPPGGGGMRIL
jgi:hypothetical protein